MKQNLKRKNIIAAILLLSAMLMGLCSCGEKQVAMGEIEDSPYPCSWEEKKNGSYVITIAGELPKNIRWDILSSSNLEVTQKGDSPVFTAKPLTEGRAALTISLRETEAPVDKGVDFSFDFTVGDSSSMILSSAEAERVDKNVLTLETGTEVYWEKNSLDGITLYFTGRNWRVESSEGVALQGPGLFNEKEWLEIFPLGNEIKGSVTLRETETKEGFIISFTVENGELLVGNCSKAKEIAPEVEKIEETPVEMTEEEEKEKELQQLIEMWKSINGKEPTEYEIQMFRNSIDRGY